jgi:hypothetical protein
MQLGADVQLTSQRLASWFVRLWLNGDQCVFTAPQHSTAMAPDIAAEVSLVSGYVASVAAQIAPDGIDIMLLVTTAGIPEPCCSPVALLDRTPFASRIVVALSALLPQLRLVVVDVCSVAPDVAQVAVNVALGKCR